MYWRYAESLMEVPHGIEDIIGGFRSWKDESEDSAKFHNLFLEFSVAEEGSQWEVIPDVGIHFAGDVPYAIFNHLHWVLGTGYCSSERLNGLSTFEYVFNRKFHRHDFVNVQVFEAIKHLFCDVEGLMDYAECFVLIEGLIAIG